MPSPKDGSPGTLVPPTDAVAAKDADNASPGQVEAIKAIQRATQTGKYGAQKVDPFKPPAPGANPQSATKASWIEIVLVDEQNKPVPGAAYEITVPDGTVASGSLDDKGLARVEGFEPGSCKVSFPAFDQDAWKLA